MHLFLSKPPDWKATDSRSVFVYIHGGAYSFGDPSWGAEYCRYFASRGMVGVSIEYLGQRRPQEERFRRGELVELKTSSGRCDVRVEMHTIGWRPINGMSVDFGLMR
jgi:hypothetical protein